MQNQKFDLVRTILRSPLFHSQVQEEKLRTLNLILNTGEITQEELRFLINEALEETSKTNNLMFMGKNLEALDYNTFLNFVRLGKIEGKDLIRLCNTSKKLNDYCNRSFQLRNNEGIYIGQPIPQYLFVTLLADRGIKLLPGQNPREIYKRRTIGGKVWSFGRSNFGQLGLSNNWKQPEYISIPTLIPDLVNIIEISCGISQSLVLDNKGRVWGFGLNAYGQLGLGDYERRLIPTLIPNLNNIVAISTGDHSLALDNRRRVWSFGRNGQGQLGLGDIVNKLIPTLISNL